MYRSRAQGPSKWRAQQAERNEPQHSQPGTCPVPHSGPNSSQPGVLHPPLPPQPQGVDGKAHRHEVPVRKLEEMKAVWREESEEERGALLIVSLLLSPLFSVSQCVVWKALIIFTVRKKKRIWKKTQDNKVEKREEGKKWRYVSGDRWWVGCCVCVSRKKDRKVQTWVFFSKYANLLASLIPQLLAQQSTI